VFYIQGSSALSKHMQLPIHLTECYPLSTQTFNVPHLCHMNVPLDLTAPFRYLLCFAALFRSFFIKQLQKGSRMGVPCELAGASSVCSKVGSWFPCWCVASSIIIPAASSRSHPKSSQFRPNISTSRCILGLSYSSCSNGKDIDH